MSSKGLMEANAVNTLNVIEQFDRIFNAVNSVSGTGNWSMKYDISRRFH